MSASMSQNLHEQISRRAYEMFETRGCLHGFDVEDWLRAEQEVSRNSYKPSIDLSTPSTTRKVQPSTVSTTQNTTNTNVNATTSTPKRRVK
ncbi:MAG: DUF2934 domain-containing protein [Chitinivibrionales bacterium]|nr:DUF2934 domain-containing protein [Chitinivibrionales bacterium]